MCSSDLEGSIVPIQSLEAHDGAVWSVAFNPNKRSFASAGEDGRIIVWDLEKVISLRGRELEYACDWLSDYVKSNPGAGICNGGD